jgi:hypothetical protein
MKEDGGSRIDAASSVRAMTLPSADHWTARLRRTLERYDEALLRRVAARLVKARSQLQADELMDRCVAAAENAAVLDRRLKDLPDAARQVLALIGHSRQPCWTLGNLVEMTMALGHGDGLRPTFDLLEAGLVYPVLDTESASPSKALLKGFEQWLAYPGGGGPQVFTLPLIASRALGTDLDLPDLSGAESEAPSPSANVQEADGLEWLLRLAVLWQRIASAPLRRTQQGGFFKRDLERLEQDPLLNGAPADHLAELPDLALFLTSLAEQEGIVQEVEGEVRAGKLPAAWEDGLSQAVESFWGDLFRHSTWNPLDGWRGGSASGTAAPGNPFPSAYLLTFLLLAQLPEGAFVRPDVLQQWLLERHPYWIGESLRPSRQRPWLAAFLLGVAYQMRLVQATRDGDGAWWVRLSPLARWLLGLTEVVPAETVYAQTLLVQPNLEIVAYRQGLTASLIARLTQFASWKSLGPACTLQLEPETVYRALELGQSFESLRLTLEQHGTRAIPNAVLDSLRTWANKRDRITIYPSAMLLEFASPEDLKDALVRGLSAVRLSDTLAVVANESGIDFRHFRLTGTRDYALPPEKCVTVEADGVSLTVDAARSDLLLETELPRFAERVEGPGGDGPRRYRLTPASLSGARASGLTVGVLEKWFQQRAGQPLPPAVRLLLTGAHAAAPRLHRYLVLQVASAELADGLLQWPQTKSFFSDRLGPTTLVLAEEHVAALRERLSAAGIVLSE